jgi:ADP-ribose pyrophosphatase YjhB (NUDIX family)
MKQAIRAIVTNNNQLLVMKRNKFGKEYYTLLGGAVEIGEELETALRRELMEEATMQVGRVQLVFIEEAEAPYGTQYVYWCEYQGGDPVLGADTIEAEINKGGQNTYEPMWLPLAELPNVNFVSKSLKAALVDSFAHGFPGEPTRLDWQY